MAHPREILNSIGANARKSLSQNFLTSPHWADMLVTQALSSPSYDEVWEIGPGLGALSGPLEKKSKKPIKLFEYDKKISVYLRETFPKLELIEGDVLDADFEKLSEGKKIAILSNLPYHLSSPLLFKFIEIKSRITRLVLTFQKEFAERLIADRRSSDYGALSVIMQLHFKIESLGVLSPGSFYPPPSISSEALLLEPKTVPGVDLNFVSQVVKAAFLHRRKKMLSNLKEIFPKIKWAEVKLPFSENARAEELSKEDFLNLSKILAKSGAGSD